MGAEGSLGAPPALRAFLCPTQLARHNSSVQSRAPESLRRTAAFSSASQSEAQAALAALERLGDAEGRAIFDGSLRAALTPFRTHAALEVICGRRECGRRIAWWALDTDAAFVAATERRARPRERLGGMRDLAKPLPRKNHGLLPWIELAQSGRTSVEIADWRNASGYPLRLKFTCRCGAVYTTTNTRRIQLYLTALSRGSGTILL